MRSHNDVAAALSQHEKRVTQLSLMIRPESLIREVPVQMKGLSPAESQSQPGTKRFAATGTQFDWVDGFNCEKAALGDRKSQAQSSLTER